ncbi:MAG TPA: glucose sorbosone dehydrogenase, partial [Planctomycetaceae bacterium]|nr:glucose sorbosone dehydrogenase [Planctomycetaceae bacterium]
GGNYGWSIVEGRQPVNTHFERGPTPILPPTVDHPHSESASITGGEFYYGKRLPTLADQYVYGDYETG